MCRYVIELNRIVLKSTCQIYHLSVAGHQRVASEAVHAAADGAVVPHLAGIRLYISKILDKIGLYFRYHIMC